MKYLKLFFGITIMLLVVYSLIITTRLASYKSSFYENYLSTIREMYHSLDEDFRSEDLTSDEFKNILASYTHTKEYSLLCRDFTKIEPAFSSIYPPDVFYLLNDINLIGQDRDFTPDEIKLFQQYIHQSNTTIAINKEYLSIQESIGNKSFHQKQATSPSIEKLFADLNSLAHETESKLLP